MHDQNGIVLRRLSAWGAFIVTGVVLSTLAVAGGQQTNCWEQQLVAPDAGHPDLALGSDGKLWLAYERSGTIYCATADIADPTNWHEEVAAYGGFYPRLRLNPYTGVPWISYMQAEQTACAHFCQLWWGASLLRAHRDASGWHTELFADSGARWDEYFECYEPGCQEEEYVIHDAEKGRYSALFFTPEWDFGQLVWTEQDYRTTVSLDETSPDNHWCEWGRKVDEHLMAEYQSVVDTSHVVQLPDCDPQADSVFPRYLPEYPYVTGELSAAEVPRSGSPAFAGVYGRMTDPGTEERGIAYWIEGATGWSKELIDMQTHPARTHLPACPSLAFRPTTGQPCVAYMNADGLLNFAERRDSGWSVQTVDSTPGSGWGCSLVMDATGQAHVAYYTENGGLVGYAHETDAGWQLARVPFVTGVAQLDQQARCALELTPAADPLVVYLSNGGVVAARPIASCEPTATPTPTVTPTATATSTVTPTPTDTPSFTPTPTITPTFTPTLSARPVIIVEVNPSPDPTLARLSYSNETEFIASQKSTAPGLSGNGCCRYDASNPRYHRYNYGVAEGRVWIPLAGTYDVYATWPDRGNLPPAKGVTYEVYDDNRPGVVLTSVDQDNTNANQWVHLLRVHNRLGWYGDIDVVASATMPISATPVYVYVDSFKWVYAGDWPPGGTPTVTPTATLAPTYTPTDPPTPTSSPAPTDTPQPTPTFNPAVDLNGDGIVDQRDLLLMQRYWHQEVP